MAAVEDRIEAEIVAENSANGAEGLIAKGVAPVQKEFLVSAQVRSTISDKDAAKISSEKKSKRKIRKERKQARKLEVCNAVVRAGDPNACPFGENCRFSHDLEGYLAQKPEDLPGVCPSVSLNVPCPYGVRCRFYGTHTKQDLPKENPEGAMDGDEETSGAGEINVLRKDFQKSLWKKLESFPKADSQLQAMGLKNKVYGPKKGATTEGENGGAETHDENNDVSDDAVPPLKKPKLVDPVDDAKEQGDGCKLNSREKKKIDLKGKLYLAPLTTVGNLPFRRLCKKLGADVTCGEMAMCTNLLQGHASEWALLRRHPVEDCFGVQICGSYADSLTKTVELIERECTVDFIDINLGCPIDIVVKKGAGSCLLTKPTRLEQIVRATASIMEKPLTLKMRTGYFEGKNCAHSMISELSNWGVSAVTVHGRTRQQRYSKLADWVYIYDCAKRAPDDLQVLGNGDIFSYSDWNEHMLPDLNLSSCMLARGALIKPWLLTEIKEQRHWDISSNERLDLLRDYTQFGLEHWGSDSKGVETTRKFLLEWLSYLHRYIPVGLLEVIPQRLNWRPPRYVGRNDLETLMASDSAADWVRISEMLLGPAPEGFVFTPKHKSSAYDKAENG
ncbi:tRNA-dihydrouridine(47) synthase [NAD(P)(+)]-like [Selaginella moellendorffii]|uniref:tRNA-dihydrouridine(47) synthase [NAD(P)(+)]-like n=1 Tax=Selaginella moellendorffii TaxID=88036 RepID=UPI000D1CF3BC|nr:tRNA-dihydrouridine(47) synthase [NAD(P)(+)]-like [Selaginella moellendorffii]|eukprot:XP_024530818.1 tRNA-dihydrouridine(47) synthase [NAD(P)(+)]-like [Selaginella moellendorffii]